MAERFTDLQMLKLVKTYRNYPCLWNVTSDLYKNRNARESAYKEIWEQLNIPGLMIKDIPQKIKNMRSSYYQELKRIEKRARSGSVYKPKVSWFATADEFLRICRNKQRTFSNINETSNTTSDNDVETHTEIEDSYNEDNSNAVDDKNINETNQIESYQNVDSSIGSLQSLKTIKQETNEYIYCTVDGIDNITNNITNSTSSIENKNKEDAYDLFGKYIAVTLRSLPDELAIIAKTNIQNALSDIQIKALRRNTQSAPLFFASTSYDPLNPSFCSSASESSITN